jgi:3-dehydroquinate dehydratase / shikimate dehydrogenase
MATLVCASILVEDPAAALAAAREALDGGADLVEFRIDPFFSGGSGKPDAHDEHAAPVDDSAGLEYEIRQVLHLVADSPLPCIVTCRPVSEGGYYDGDDAARISLFERLGTAFGDGEHPPRFLDVELSTVERSANIRQKVNLAIDHPEQLRDVRTSLILSLHDFAGRPADLSRQLLRMQGERSAKVLKVAYRARSLRDNIELFEMLAGRDRPMIALAMGEYGLMSRVLAGKFGAFLTFAGLRDQTATAPGQPSLNELLGLYRFRSISRDTRVYGVIGYPVAQSLSPHIHNAGFEAVNHDGVYLPLPIAGGGGTDGGGYESLKATLGELMDFVPLHFSGVSITHPHKENLVRLAREMGWQMSPFASACGAGNTLLVERDSGGSISTVRVSNSDAPALLACLRSALGEIRGRRVVILGSGGLAKAAAMILAWSGATPIICARRPEMAEKLAAQVVESGAGAETADWQSRSSIPCDAIVNCTPLGMTGTSASAESPLSPEDCRRLPPGTLVFDTVYNPALTPLLRAAQAAGLRTVDGVSMFVHQAADQFTMWTGTPQPLALFERIVREQLSG